MCTRTESWRSDEIAYTPTHTVPKFPVSSLWFEYGGVRAEGLVTLEQGDRSRQVCRCVCIRMCTLSCQRFVPGQQVASQRTSVTFSLSLPISSSLCPSLPLSPSPSLSYPEVNVLCTTHRHIKEMIHQVWVDNSWTHVKGCFDTTSLNNANV